MEITLNITPSEFASLFGTRAPSTDVDTVTPKATDWKDFNPLTSEQRKTLFGLFTDVFGVRDQAARRTFTRKVLDTSSDDVSWSSSKGDGSITQNEADKLIDFLRTAKAVFDLV